MKPLYQVAENGCWLWLGGLSTNGYGRWYRDGKMHQAHRLFWEDVHGPVPKGLEMDHLCGHRSCVNPAHLAAVSHRENTLRGNTVTADCLARTHCPAGHPYSASNTYHDPEGYRRCRECKRAEDRRVSKALANRSKTHCPKGHPYSVENTYQSPNRRSRHCRMCEASRDKQRKAAKRADAVLARLARRGEGGGSWLTARGSDRRCGS